MPFAKGHKKVGGRKAGAPNKITSDIAFALAEHDCDPILGLVKIAKDKKHSPELKFRVLSELANYVYSKRRSLEVTAGKSNPTGALIVTYSDDQQQIRELKAKVAELTDSRKKLTDGGKKKK